LYLQNFTEPTGNRQFKTVIKEAGEKRLDFNSGDGKKRAVHAAYALPSNWLIANHITSHNSHK
jgi:hypothetical protein